MFENIDGWLDNLYTISDTKGSVSPSVYFVLLNLFGAFGCMILILAVLEEKFREAYDELKEERNGDDLKEKIMEIDPLEPFVKENFEEEMNENDATSVPMNNIAILPVTEDRNLDAAGTADQRY